MTSDGQPVPRGAPARSGLVLFALILTAAVANLNLAVANVALPDIGKFFDASQISLNLVAVGYSLGLAASVLYFGAIGDRYGRKAMCLGGITLSVPACVAAAYAPSIGVLVAARIVGGLSAGMAYPTTLALITALWTPGEQRTRAIALWSALGGAVAAIGPLCAGAMLEHFWWGSVFLITLPLAVVALVLAVVLIPSHVNEAREAIDNLGGVISVALIAGLILAINLVPVPGKAALVVALAIITLVAGAAFVMRQRRAANPLYDLAVAARPTFWVGACSGVIVFGSLMGAMYIGQQFMQNVLGYSTVDAGAAILPMAILMVCVAPRSAKLVETRGSRFTLLVGYVFVLLGFVTMLVLWERGDSYWQVGPAYAFVGIGVGLAGTPASHSLTASVPVLRAGMASATADLQRDLGGAIMQSIFGALLTVGYVSTATKLVPSSVNSSVQSQLTKSFAGAADTASKYPQYASQIVAGAQKAFLHGADLAYSAGIVAVVLGAAVVFFAFPKRDHERELLEQYQRVIDLTGSETDQAAVVDRESAMPRREANAPS
ncbi:MAG TPA: MFS transporter [Acidimicrobiia bacterium]|jgi:MFS family permease